ncbi:hypothetical protein ACC695_40075, partial [Rhizobium ruizarguesonis]
LAALFLVIVLGLVLRRFGYSADLPFIVVKYGGSALCGAMVYLLVPDRRRRPQLCRWHKPACYKAKTRAKAAERLPWSAETR